MSGVTVFDSGRRPWEQACSGPHSDNLPRSGSKTRRLGRFRLTEYTGFTAASRQIAGKRAPTPAAEADMCRALDSLRQERTCVGR